MGTGGPGWTITGRQGHDHLQARHGRHGPDTSAANSGSSQFFIVLNDSAQSSLGATAANNYAIFGNVTSGMDVVDRIALVPLGGDPRRLGEPPRRCRSSRSSSPARRRHRRPADRIHRSDDLSPPCDGETTRRDR